MPVVIGAPTLRGLGSALSLRRWLKPVRTASTSEAPSKDQGSGEAKEGTQQTMASQVAQAVQAESDSARQAMQSVQEAAGLKPEGAIASSSRGQSPVKRATDAVKGTVDKVKGMLDKAQHAANQGTHQMYHGREDQIAQGKENIQQYAHEFQVGSKPVSQEELRHQGAATTKEEGGGGGEEHRARPQRMSPEEKAGRMQQA